MSGWEPEHHGSGKPPLHSSRETVLINMSADGEAKTDREMDRVLATAVSACESDSVME